MILDDKTQALLQRVTRSLEESEARVEQSRTLIQRCQTIAERCRRGDEWMPGETGCHDYEDEAAGAGEEEEEQRHEGSQGRP